jgi:hypothetical protein
LEKNEDPDWLFSANMETRLDMIADFPEPGLPLIYIIFGAESLLFPMSADLPDRRRMSPGVIKYFQPDIDLCEDALASGGHASRDIVPAAFDWFQRLEGTFIVLIDMISANIGEELLR